MARHWHRQAGRRADHARLAINGLGAAATGVALAIILTAKFAEGAWLTIVVIPATLILLRVVNRYYANLDQQLLSGRQQRLDLREHAAPLVVIPIGRWDRVSQQGVAYALRLSPDVTALHCTDLDGPDAEQQENRIRTEWRGPVGRVPAPRGARGGGGGPPRLLVEASPYRSVLAPLLRTIDALKQRHPGRAVAVVLPLLVEARWWEWLLHTHRERRLRKALLRDGGADLAVVGVPWRLRAPETEELLAEEEPRPA